MTSLKYFVVSPPLRIINTEWKVRLLIMTIDEMRFLFFEWCNFGFGIWILNLSFIDCVVCISAIIIDPLLFPSAESHLPTVVHHRLLFSQWMSPSLIRIFHNFFPSFVGGLRDKSVIHCLKRNTLVRSYYQLLSRSGNSLPSLESRTSSSLPKKTPTFLLLQSLTTMGDSQAEERKKEIEARKAELKKRLTPLQYHVTQEKGTERYSVWKLILFFLFNIYILKF